jgi:putative chitinase
MINTLKRILDRAANTKVIMLTARADFDDKDKFLSTFEKYGIDMSRIHVHRAGNLPGDEPPAYKKAVWVRKYLNTGKYNRVNLIDDSMTNLKVFKSLEQEYPNVDFDAYFVKSSGSVAVVSESRRKKKSRQRKQNSLFSRNTYGGYGAWGPGPYGGYGYDSGYSGDGGGEAESIKEKLDSYGNVKGDPIGDLISNIQKKKQPTSVDKKISGQAAQPAPITGNPLESTLRNFALKAGIKGKELAQFLAQCAHETANYATLVEFGTSDEFLKKYDKQFSPDKAKELGNTMSGDGQRFKGRGFIQLTGRWNYTQAGQALGLPLDNKPELLEKPEIAAKASVWFWKNRVQPNVKNFTDTRTVTRYINPGLAGLQKRHGIFQNYLKTMNTPIKEGDLIPWPKGTVKVDVSDTYDWYKLGQHISNLKGLGKHDFGQGPPQTVLSFGSEPLEHEYIKYLKQLGLDTHDIDENFADGKNPQDKGDSARHGIPKKSSISTLKKIRSSDTASPRKKQLAHWQINMRQGKKRSSK